MRFLFVSEYYPPIHMGGAEISLKFLVEGLAELGHEVTVLTPNYDIHRTNVEMHRNLRIIRFKSWRYFLFRKKTRELSSGVYTRKKPLFYLQLGEYIRLSAAELRKNAEKLLDREDFDLVHANNLESILALSRVKTQAVKVAHLRDFGIMCWNRGLNNRGRLCGGCSSENLKSCIGAGLTSPLLSYEIHLRERVIDDYDRLIAISNFVKGQFIRRLGVSPSKVGVLYNPISPNVVSKLSKEEARKLLGLHPNRDIVLFVGTLSEMKGAHMIPALARELPEVLFLVVGDGPLSRLFKENQLENLVYRGYQPVEVLKHYYRATDVLIVPSLWHEPFGRVVVEGIANGCFVIGSNRGAIPEVIQWAGLGKFVEPELKDLVRAITSYFENPIPPGRGRSIVLNYSKEYPYKFIKLTLGEGM